VNPALALEVLSEGTKLLADTNWWVSAGTALGAYRDALSDEFLARDTDLDVEVEGYIDLKPIFMDSGFKVHTEASVGPVKCQLALVKNGIIFDIYFYTRGVSDFVNFSEFGAVVVPSHLIDNAKIVNVRGIDLRFPSPPEEYLATRYGKDWAIPQPKKNWWEQAANMVRP